MSTQTPRWKRNQLQKAAHCVTQRRASHLCITCGEPSPGGFVRCDVCRVKNSLAVQASKSRKRQQTQNTPL